MWGRVGASCVKHGQIEVLVPHGLSVGGKNDVAGWAAPANLFGAKIPKARSAVAVHEQELPPVRTEAHVRRKRQILFLVAAENTQLLSGLDSPEVDSAVRKGSRERLAVGCEGQLLHRRPLGVEHAQWLSALRIPQVHTPAAVSGRDKLPIRRVVGKKPSGVPLQFRKLLPRFPVP